MTVVGLSLPLDALGGDGRPRSIGVAWFDALREKARDAFSRAGLPTRKTESWKYTDLAPLRGTSFRGVRDEEALSRDVRVPGSTEGISAVARLVFVNGLLRADLSSTAALPPGVSIEPLSVALKGNGASGVERIGGLAPAQSNPLIDLNGALMTDGFCLKVGAGVRASAPIEIVHMNGVRGAAVAMHPRNLIVVGDDASVTVVERYEGMTDSPYLVNSVTEVDVGNSAVLDHVKVQAEGPGAFHLAVTRARVADDGAYNGFALALGARLSRAEAWVDLNGCHGSCRLAGAYLLRDRQHCDNTTVIEHRVPHTTCREVFRGVLDDGARAVFQGRIVVKREAQHADGQQSSKALLLSDQSEVDQKPELEIYADAVKCSHGATAGQIDGNALFYLRSRGIPEVEARRLLIESFLEDALEQIGPEDLRAAMRSEIAGWFAAEKGGAL